MLDRFMSPVLLVCGLLLLPQQAIADAPLLPSPTEAQLSEVKTRIVDAYGPIPSDPDKLADLTGLIREDAKKASDVVVRYAMLDTVVDHAVKLQRVKLAINTLGEIESQYEGDLFDRRYGVLKALGTIASDVDQRNVVVSQTVAMAQELIDERSFVQAKRLVELASTLAKKTNDRDQILAIRNFEKQISSMEREQKAYLRALEVLKRDKDNASARKVVGEYTCYVMGMWPEGLVDLSACDVPDLAAVAEMELTFDPTPAALQKLGDSWWDIAEREQNWKQQRIRLHAAELYRAALPGVTSVLDKRAMEKRIEEAGLGQGADLAGTSDDQPKWVVMTKSKQALEKAGIQQFGDGPKAYQYQDGALTLNKTTITFTGLRVKDFVLSARVTKHSGENLSLGVFTEQGFAFWFSSGKWFGLYHTTQGDLGQFTSETPFNGEFEMTMVVVGDQVHFYAGGNHIGKRTHKQLDAEGVLWLTASNGKSTFRDVKLLPLDGYPELAKEVLAGEWSGVPKIEKSGGE
ncbi:MAG: hypothetical protein ACPG4Q_03460 [Phycisphaeraceae bacterium]